MTSNWLNALKSMLEADNALLAGENESVGLYWQAITCAEKVWEPNLFNKDLMIAYSNAGLSKAYAEQGMFVESLASADRSLTFLEKTFDANSFSDAERLTMSAISKTRALMYLARLDEAQRAFCNARSILRTSNIWSPEDKLRFQELAIELKVEDA
jgi:hypothetical protein